MKRIEVAVGIIINSQQQVLVAQRTVKDLYFNKWEFPGGKLEAGESPEQALIRELNEELGIEVISARAWKTLQHDYSDRKVRLFIQIVEGYTGEAKGQEGQAIAWVDYKALTEMDFLTGNRQIIDALAEQLQH